MVQTTGKNNRKAKELNNIPLSHIVQSINVIRPSYVNKHKKTVNLFLFNTEALVNPYYKQEKVHGDVSFSLSCVVRIDNLNLQSCVITVENVPDFQCCKESEKNFVFYYMSLFITALYHNNTFNYPMQKYTFF